MIVCLSCRCALRDTQAMCPCVVTPWHVFADVMIVLFCKHTSCGHWVLVLRICTLAFLLNLVLLELVMILHLQIPKIRLFRKSKLAKFRKLHSSEKYPFYSTHSLPTFLPAHYPHDMLPTQYWLHPFSFPIFSCFSLCFFSFLPLLFVDQSLQVYSHVQPFPDTYGHNVPLESLYKCIS